MISADDARAKLEAARGGGSGRLDAKVSVSQWLTFWLTEIVPGTVKPRTLVAYREVSRMYIEPHVGGVTLADLGPEHLTRMQNALAAAGLASGTRRHVRDVLSVALNKAEAWGKLPGGNPTRFTARPKARPVRDEWTAAEAHAILAAAAGDRLEALAVVMLYLGLRPFEVLALRWTDLVVDSPSPTLTVLESKTDAGIRTLPLPSTVAAALRAHRARQAAEQLAAEYWHDRGVVFASELGAALKSRWLGEWWKALVAVAGFEHRRLYSARHTAATLMLGGGVPLEVVSKILGHSGLAITADVYAHVGDQLKRGAADVMDRVLG
jgi:integrase